MCSHAEGQTSQRTECSKIGRFKGSAVSIHHRQFVVAVGTGSAVARQVLKNRKDAASLQTISYCFGNNRNLAWLLAIGAVADDRIAICHRHVHDRQAVDIDAQRPKVGRDQMAREPRGRDAGSRLTVIKFAVERPGRIGGPIRRPKPLDAATFLIHKDGGLPP